MRAKPDLFNRLEVCSHGPGRISSGGDITSACTLPAQDGVFAGDALSKLWEQCFWPNGLLPRCLRCVFEFDCDCEMDGIQLR